MASRAASNNGVRAADSMRLELSPELRVRFIVCGQQCEIFHSGGLNVAPPVARKWQVSCIRV